MPDCSQHYIRVYYEDTDLGGIVYYANYLRFMERARTEMLRCFGFELDVLKEKMGVVFVVRRAKIDFRSPARFNDYLRLHTRIREARGARLTFEQHVFIENRCLCVGNIEVVCLEPERMRPVILPLPLREAVERYFKLFPPKDSA